MLLLLLLMMMTVWSSLICVDSVANVVSGLRIIRVVAVCACMCVGVNTHVFIHVYTCVYVADVWHSCICVVVGVVLVVVGMCDC